MSNQPPSNPNASQIAHPVNNPDALVTVAQQLKQAVDSLTGNRGNPLDRAITFHDVIRLGLADETTIKSADGATGYANSTDLKSSIANYSSDPHTWSAKQTFSSKDGSIGVLIAGDSDGIVFLPSASGMTIKGTSKDGTTSYQPLIIDASAITLAASGTKSFFYGPNGVAITNKFVVTNGGVAIGNPTGGDPGAGGINAESIKVNGVNVQTVTAASAFSQNSPGNPTGTTSGAGVMMGLGILFTPTKSGNVLIIISGDTANSAATGGVIYLISTGTGSAPANGAALTGTQRGPIQQRAANTASGLQLPFSIQAIAPSLVVGTQYWIDLGVGALTTGTASVLNLSVSVVEL